MHPPSIIRRAYEGIDMPPGTQITWDRLEHMQAYALAMTCKSRDGGKCEIVHTYPAEYIPHLGDREILATLMGMAKDLQDKVDERIELDPMILEQLEEQRRVQHAIDMYRGGLVSLDHVRGLLEAPEPALPPGREADLAAKVLKKRSTRSQPLPGA